MKYKVIIIIALIITLVAIVGCKQEPISIGAHSLYNAYATNEIKADMDYKGKILAVTGVVGYLGRTSDGKACVILRGGWTIEDIFQRELGVQCNFNKRYEYQAAELREGNYIKIRGKCAGFDYLDNHIILNNCRVID